MVVVYVASLAKSQKPPYTISMENLIIDKEIVVVIRMCIKLIKHYLIPYQCERFTHKFAMKNQRTLINTAESEMKTYANKTSIIIDIAREAEPCV